MKTFWRLAILICIILAVLGVPFMASAIPNACGYATVTVLGFPVHAQGLTYCDDCPGGVSQGPNDPWVWPVQVESYECIHFW